MSKCDLYVIDKRTNRIHRIGDEPQDGLWVGGNVIYYHNLHYIDGGGAEDVEWDSYCILRSEYGMLENDYGIIDKRFEEQIRKYLAERNKTDDETRTATTSTTSE